MPSLKSHLVAFVLRRTRKKAFTSAAELNRWIAAARRTEDHRPPPALAKRLDIRQRHVAGFPVYDIAPRAGIRNGQRILYLHGGAYVFEITRFHWNLIAEMSERLGVRITVPIYPIAPQHDIHAMLGMIMQVYAAMLEDADGRDILFMGDSAGGNMAVVLTMMAAERGMALPSRHVLISPCLDVSLENPAAYEVEKVDPWLGIAGGLEAIRHYSAGLARTDWRISPVFGNLAALPPTLILTGTRDLLYPDTVSFAEKARKAGVEVELVVEKGMFHVWTLIDMPEARRARDGIVAYLAAAPLPHPDAVPGPLPIPQAEPAG
ncbi:alpha/beta hydrolase [Arvimicrobium flavum]|uniref:alpha/beta hydrolase n=1 Tax=Arvimicrobium flavum TaxID=3393320 RepID=UPI00237AAB09|nr:alpha/beta hydrolase [Mesorhizobium shangrilense]